MSVQGDGWPVFLLSPGSPIRHLSPPCGTTPHKQTAQCYQSLPSAGHHPDRSQEDRQCVLGNKKRLAPTGSSYCPRCCSSLPCWRAHVTGTNLIHRSPSVTWFPGHKAAWGGIGIFFFFFFLLKLTAIANNLLLLLYICVLLILIIFYFLMNVELKMPNARKTVVNVSIYFDNSVLCHKRRWL